MPHGLAKHSTRSRCPKSIVPGLRSSSKRPSLGQRNERRRTTRPSRRRSEPSRRTGARLPERNASRVFRPSSSLHGGQPFDDDVVTETRVGQHDDGARALSPTPRARCRRRRSGPAGRYSALFSPRLHRDEIALTQILPDAGQGDAEFLGALGDAQPFAHHPSVPRPTSISCAVAATQTTVTFVTFVTCFLCLASTLGAAHRARSTSWKGTGTHEDRGHRR